MLNIIELEQRWLKYKIKSYIPLITIVFSSIIIITIVMFLFSSSEETIHTSKIEEKPLPKKNEKVVVSKTIKENNISNTSQVFTKSSEVKQLVPVKNVNLSKIDTQKKSQVKLSPSLDFMKKMQNSVQPYYQSEVQEQTKVQDTPQRRDTPKAETPKQKEIVVERNIQKHKGSKINIERRNTQKDIYEIIKRFKKNNNPALSLFIAKKYYELGDYKQAYNYALITNEINKDIESSWIVFAKSLVKMGKKKKALSTLKEYFNYSHSSSAKILYDEIRSGKFK